VIGRRPRAREPFLILAITSTGRVSAACTALSLIPCPLADGPCFNLKATTMAKPTEEQIRIRAHELWEQNHRPDGRDDEFWHQAERELSQGVTPDEKSETFLE
jgi:Protein of unknown function (DUF2934)